MQTLWRFATSQLPSPSLPLPNPLLLLTPSLMKSSGKLESLLLILWHFGWPNKRITLRWSLEFYLPQVLIQRPFTRFDYADGWTEVLDQPRNCILKSWGSRKPQSDFPSKLLPFHLFIQADFLLFQNPAASSFFPSTSPVITTIMLLLPLLKPVPHDQGTKLYMLSKYTNVGMWDREREKGYNKIGWNTGRRTWNLCCHASSLVKLIPHNSPNFWSQVFKINQSIKSRNSLKLFSLSK